MFMVPRHWITKMFICEKDVKKVVNLVLLVILFNVWDLPKGSAVYTSGFDFVCVVGPPVVDTYSPKPVTLNGFVDGFFDDSVGYSITFSSRDDGSIVTNGDIARFGKIGTQKGEKGDKGDFGGPGGCGAMGDPGEDGLDGTTQLPGPAGEEGPEGPPGPMGSFGTGGPGGTDGTDEFYCVGELPSCGSNLHGYQCVQGAKGPKGTPGSSCAPGQKGEKGEPPYPSLLGDPGPPGPQGSQGPQGPPGPDGIPGDDGVNAPQAVCSSSTSTIKGSPGINLEVGHPGDPGDPGLPDFGQKGSKGQPGTPAAMPGAQGPAGTQGPQGSPGPVGPQGFVLGGFVGDPGLFIRPLFQGSQGPSCVSNVVVAVEKLSLYEPKEENMKDMRFGVYYCDFFTRGTSFHVPTLLYNQDELIPADAKRTFVVSVGDELSLCVDNKLPKKHVGQLEWVHNGNRTDKLKKWSGSSCFHIKCVQNTDAGIYEAFKRPVGRNAKQHAYFIVIVRACPDGKYNAPLCDSSCPGGCEHGYCSAETGSCICYHGFNGPGCSANGEGLLGGSSGNIPCLDLGFGRSCEGALVCSERAGCTCASGWKGIHCDEPCESGTYGPDCCFDCPASSPVCNRFTGLACSSLV